MEYAELKISKQEWVTITPEVAAKLLAKNVANRNLSPAYVRQIASAMIRGAFRITHQAIAIDSYGHLLDGQSRLSAVVECGIPQKFLIVTYAGNHTALGLPIDIGRTRTTSDITGIERRSVSIVKSWFRCLFSDGNSGRHHDLVATCYAAMQSHILAVLEVAPCNSRGVGAAAVKAAVVLRRACGVDFTEQYAHMDHGHLRELTPSSESLYKRLCEPTKEGGMRLKERFALTWYASSPLMQRSKVLRITEASLTDAISEARASFKRVCPSVYHVLCGPNGD